ncbi:MAG: PQQ-binding-like beta-propeller repeat protein [Candidatus Bathyarchaeota archaeon]|nr:PQQ-binding-like beta-propeller repeat protein [Candidatus Bathyarchaeota archaeon]
MIEKRQTLKILVAILTAAMLISTVTLLAGAQTNTTDYGDIMQYDWPQQGHDSGETRFNPGPAPDKPTLLWSGSKGAIYSVFNGLAFSTSGSTLYAYDAFTGQLRWQTTMPFPSSSNPTKIDDAYMFVDHGASYASDGGVTIFRISDGAYISNVNMTTGKVVGWNHPGGGSYYPGMYSSEMKMKYRVAFDTATNEQLVIAADLSDPVNPKVGWVIKTDLNSEIMTTGDGKVFIGSYSGYRMYALDGLTGALVWESFCPGIVGYCAMYTEGLVLHGGGTKVLIAYNATNGNIEWKASLDDRCWFAHGGASAYGRYYGHVIAEGVRPDGVPMGYYACWDLETGELLWKTNTNYIGGYWSEALADGKVYAMLADNPNWGGISNPIPNTYACFDAFTGEILWTVQASSVSNFIVAYGNLYAGSDVYGANPQDWSYWRGDMSNQGVAVGQAAPMDISVPVWVYEADGPIASSAAIVDGKAYVGSYDKNIYCLNAYTGNLVWKFPTQGDISSSVAVAGNTVYVGPDDGYVYAINKDTGQEIWRKDIYASNVPAIEFEVATWQVRSSPIVVGSSLYVGALDGKVYCLSTADGSTKWTYQTDGPIGGSPTYSGGTIYIASTDRNLYALNAENGNVEWTWTTPKTGSGARQMFFVGTPTIADGKLFIGGGGRSLRPSGPILVALDATTGAEIYVVNTGEGGNSNQPWCATYVDGVLYAEAFMSAVAFNATDGSVIWAQWLGHQVTSSPAYANEAGLDLVYIGCDSYSVTCFNASNGAPISWFTADAQIVASPAIYNGMMIVGSADGKIYAFSDIQTVETTVWAESSKGSEMWPNEAITIAGTVNGVSSYINPLDESVQTMYPGLPNAEVIISFTKPDQTSINVTATTDNFGNFQAEFTPTIVGQWGWVAYYPGQKSSAVNYAEAYSSYNELNVVAQSNTDSTPQATQTPTTTESPTTQATSTPTETANALPVEYIYAAIASIVVVVIVVAAYAYTKRKTR